MYMSFELLLLAYFAVTIVGLSLLNLLKLNRGILPAILLLIANLSAALAYYYFRPSLNFFAQFDQVSLILVLGLVAVNSLLPFADRGVKLINPLYYVMLNIFTLLALRGSNLQLIALGIIGLRFCDLAMATGQTEARDGTSLFKQYLHLVIVILCLGTSIVFSVFAGDFNLWIAHTFFIMALVFDTGLLNLRMIRRYDITNRRPVLTFFKYLSINQAVLFSFLFYLNQSSTPFVHWLVLSVVAITCFVQLIGFTQSRSVYHYMPRLYLINISLIIILYSYCRDHGMLSSILYFSFAQHLIQPLVIGLYQLNENRRWTLISKLTLVLAMGWITLLPLPSSFFARLSLMLMNAGSFNWIFYLLYLLTLVVATGSLLQRGMRYYQNEALLDRAASSSRAYGYLTLLLLMLIVEIYLAVAL